MNIVNKKEPLILLCGDLFVLYVSIWITLLVRHIELPDLGGLIGHIQPFSILFLAWIAIFYVAGLYDRFNVVAKRHLPKLLVTTQIVNIVLAIVFFYFIPAFSITPKITLFIYLIVSLGLLAGWRIFVRPLFYRGEREKSLLIAHGEEMIELKNEVNRGKYGFYFTNYINLDKVDSLNLQDEIVAFIYSEDIKNVVIDSENVKIQPLLNRFYNLMFSKVRFVDMHTVYEQVFAKIPISIVGHGWFLRHITTDTHMMYDGIKRVVDVMIGLAIGLVSLIFYPFVCLAIKMQDGGSIFFTQERIGKDNKKIKIYKFRSMADDKVTSVGNFLRKTRIDELPQIWNVIRGDLSLIGPRPEKVDMVASYNAQIPYYNIRHLIKPGLSGWAQIYHENHPHHELDVIETKNKLAYDLFYVKNRSLFLDFEIFLKTARTIILRSGR